MQIIHQFQGNAKSCLCYIKIIQKKKGWSDEEMENKRILHLLFDLIHVAKIEPFEACKTLNDNYVYAHLCW